MANREKFLSSFSKKNKTRKNARLSRGGNKKGKGKRRFQDARRRKQEEWSID